MTELTRRSLLRVEVARPCPVSWDSMAGDERVRYCSICQKCVYNLSAMKLDEARQLVEEREGSVCVRFFRREDGTAMTSDCGFGLERVRRSVRRGVGAVLGLLAAVFGGVTLFGDDLRRCFGASVTGALAAPALTKTPRQARHMEVTGMAMQTTAK